MHSNVKIIECPRDAMQGIPEFISTRKKIEYINQLLKVGFHTVDVGSFVSSKAIPQLRDTAAVLDEIIETTTKLLIIVANTRGAISACDFSCIDYLGFPLSVSEVFQKRNTNKTIKDSLIQIEEIQEISIKNNKELVVYLSMAFGNPYNENYHTDLVAELTDKLNNIEVRTISLSDTIGVSQVAEISEIFSTLIKEFNHIEFGAHFHTTLDSWKEKIDASFDNGCRRFDSTIMGVGGCPMANDNLVGNMPTEKIVNYFNVNLNQHEFSRSIELANLIFT